MQKDDPPPAAPQLSAALFPKAKAARSLWEIFVCCACCCCSSVAREEDEAVHAILNEWSARLNNSPANAYDVVALADDLRRREGGSFVGSTQRHQKAAADAAVIAFQRQDPHRPHRDRSSSLHRYVYNQQEMQRVKRANREKMMRDFVELEELFSGTDRKDMTADVGLAALPKSKSKTQDNKEDHGDPKKSSSPNRREKIIRFRTPADELNEEQRRNASGYYHDHYHEKDYLMRSLSFSEDENDESDGSTDSGISDLEGHYSMMREAEMLERKRRQRIRQAEVEQEANLNKSSIAWPHRPSVDGVGIAAAKGPLSTRERKISWGIDDGDRIFNRKSVPPRAAPLAGGIICAEDRRRSSISNVSTCTTTTTNTTDTTAIEQEQRQAEHQEKDDTSFLLFATGVGGGGSRRGSRRRSSASVDSAELQTVLEGSSMGRERTNNNNNNNNGIEVAPSYFTTSPLYRATFKAAFTNNAFTSTADKKIRSPHHRRRSSNVDPSYLDVGVSSRERHQQQPKRLKPLFASQLRTEVQERFASSSITSASARKGKNTSNPFRSSVLDKDDLLPDVLPPPKSVIVFEHAHKIQPLQKL